MRDSNHKGTKTLILFLIVVCAFVSLWLDLFGSSAAQTPVKVEECVYCHELIEPMHKYGPTDTLEKLKDGKDAVGLSCTACHGGNPVSRVKEEAHVQPKYPREWRRNG